ncbi:ABC transporter substrate-binding protein [Aeromicrobium sp. YIM 150415]|uniref:ABC transporter substrate-binding protein n=1 Tax=Aeromicrobium piscarium TaxID=2590901 RepID=A0A554S8A1_9ACTN|nr:MULTISPECIES: ABC transporter substrate-binding protein [Aeromicrobium]MBM9465233.1 ABC transporter substrate-binding protein [Aeromicrobium sp. YIM 150415]TSD62563.1 ABC transporter substrate-binding protein [Aeromicrobium piscarium]
MQKKLSLASAAVASCVVLAACSGGGGGGGDEEIVIGAVHPLTGALAGEGALMSAGAKLAVEDINEAGGIECLDGAQLSLSTGDSQGTAATGQTEAQRLVDSGAVALIGTYQSDVTQNVASVAERAGVPLVIDVAVDDAILEQGYQNSFRIQPNASSMGEDGATALEGIFEEAGEELSTVSYIHIEGAFGESVFSAFEEKAAADGIDVNEVTYAAANFSDATQVVSRALSSDPDIVVVTGYYPDSLLIASALQQLGSEVDVYGIANGAFDNTSFPGDAGTAGDGILSANYHYNMQNERVEDIRSRFEEEAGEPMETAAVLSYQAVEVIAEALQESCDTDPGAVRDAIADIEVDDPLLAFDGPITFGENGENENATVIVTQIADGQIQQVFPEEFKTADLTFPTR